MNDHDTSTTPHDSQASNVSATPWESTCSNTGASDCGIPSLQTCSIVVARFDAERAGTGSAVAKGLAKDTGT